MQIRYGKYSSWSTMRRCFRQQIRRGRWDLRRLRWGSSHFGSARHSLGFLRRQVNDSSFNDLINLIKNFFFFVDQKKKINKKYILKKLNCGNETLLQWILVDAWPEIQQGTCFHWQRERCSLLDWSSSPCCLKPGSSGDFLVIYIQKKAMFWK